MDDADHSAMDNCTETLCPNSRRFPKPLKVVHETPWNVFRVDSVRHLGQTQETNAGEGRKNLSLHSMSLSERTLEGCFDGK